ncbi:hypothetical protein ATCC90586_002319 [Pythium insidiosum]|nr:hypothetical protein ATCC90586_002319 [Pythium insidiosum]
MNTKTLAVVAAAAVLATQVQADCADQEIKCYTHSSGEPEIRVGFCWSWGSFACLPCRNGCDSCRDAFGGGNVAAWGRYHRGNADVDGWWDRNNC